MTDRIPIRRALISVSDKTGLLPLARALAAQGTEIISTGGSARALRDAGIAVVEVAQHSGFPEILDGRVKTLVPQIHGGILGRRDLSKHVSEMAAHGIAPIDLVAVNLYPFEATVAAGADFGNSVEQIDIGGPALIRAAAKNHDFVAVLTDPAQYDDLLAELVAQGGTTLALRRRLAAAAYARTAAYDAAIAAWFAEQEGQQFPARLAIAGTLRQTLRYGENPHQGGALYLEPQPPQGIAATARMLAGKELSFNNLADADAALECVKAFQKAPACVIVKHANPCGVALGADIRTAYERAYACDPTSAFGGIIAFNQPLDVATAEAILARQFVEVVLAPEIAPAAQAVFARKPNVRVLATGAWPEQTAPVRDYKRIAGGLLVQDADRDTLLLTDLKVVSRRVPDAEELRDLLFAWHVAMFVKSNAIVYARDGRTVGIGAGQMSRVISARIAALKAAEAGLEVRGSVLASDAFFPFRDGIDTAAAAGIRAVIQPGGSMRDAEAIAAADEHGMAMVFTGVRHFRH